MRFRIRLSPVSADDVLKRLEGHRFPVTVKREPFERAGMTLIHETRTVDDETAAREFVRGLADCEDVDLIFEHSSQMPGMRPFSLLTVVLNDEGKAVNAFYG